MIILFLCIFFSFFVSHISRNFVYIPCILKQEKSFTRTASTCVYLYWRTTLTSFYTKRIEIVFVLSMDQKLPMTILKLRSIDFMKRILFFLIRKKCEEWRETINFLFLRNHNKNFGNKCQKIRERWKTSIPQLSFYFLYLTVY